MIKLKILNDLAELNNFKYVENLEYIPGIPTVIKFQIIDAQTTFRKMVGSSAKVNVIFQTRTGTSLTKAGSLLNDPLDTSMWKVELTGTNTTDIVGGNFQVVLDEDGSSTQADLMDSATVQSGMAYNILSKIQFDGEC